MLCRRLGRPFSIWKQLNAQKVSFAEIQTWYASKWDLKYALWCYRTFLIQCLICFICMPEIFDVLKWLEMLRRGFSIVWIGRNMASLVCVKYGGVLSISVWIKTLFVGPCETWSIFSIFHKILCLGIHIFHSIFLWGTLYFKRIWHFTK